MDRFLILIAERNKNIREFLRRELVLEGYDVELAKNDKEIFMRINSAHPPALIVLDLDISGLGGIEIIEKIKKRENPIPVIIYVFYSEYVYDPVFKGIATFVEKTDNIENLKDAIKRSLWQYYPVCKETDSKNNDNTQSYNLLTKK